MPSRRSFVKTVGLGISTYTFSSHLPAQAANKGKRPNIIYLMADDQNTYSVGCYGNKEVKTPNMDQLGRDGMVFDNHYSTTAICMASRANVMTGKYDRPRKFAPEYF